MADLERALVGEDGPAVRKNISGHARGCLASLARFISSA
jgi:hypothetical protein